MQLIPRGLRMRPMLATGMAFALCTALAVRPSAADVAEWIPSDALVVFKVNNLQQVNSEAGALLREFGVAEQNPDAADPLSAFQRESGIREGVNLEGDLGIYLANGDLEGDIPPMVILIPVSDYQAFLNNFRNRQDEGDGITRVVMGNQEDVPEGDMGDDGDAGYIMEMGEYAALTPMKELLKGRPGQAIEFNGVTAQHLEERDVIFYANFQQLGPMLLQKMQEEGAREQAKQEMLQELEQEEQFARFRPVAETAIDQFFNIAERFLNDTAATTLTMDLGDQGIAFGAAAQFKPDSGFAGLFEGIQTSDDSLLTGLPEAAYIVFGGSASNREVSQRVFDEFVGPIIAQLREVEGTEKLAEYVDAVKTQMSAVGDTRFGVFAPSGPLGGSALLQQVTIQGGDVDQLMQSQRRVAELQPEIMAELLGGEMEEMGMGMNMAIQYEENAKQVAGIEFDKLSTRIDEDQQQQGGMGAMPMRMMFGPEGPVTYLGEVDGKLLMVSGLSDQQIEQVVESARGGADPLAQDQGVQMVLDQLMDDRAAVFFFRPDELVRSGVGYARQMGMNMPIQMQENLPPAGFAFGPAENALLCEAFFPKDLISALIVATIQAQQQMGGMDDGL